MVSIFFEYQDTVNIIPLVNFGEDPGSVRAARVFEF